MTSKRALAAIVAGALCFSSSTSAQDRSAMSRQPLTATSLSVEGTAVLGGATQWLNSPPLTVAGLHGKVVLVEFWTYSCINWLRTLPYVRAWAAKYKDQGLVVIGVHTPEFEFEKNLDNLRRAAADLRVDYPIAVDSDRAVWRSFANDAWPALYFIDASGHIRHHRFGEGDYEESERVIQQLLVEAGARPASRALISVEGSGVETAADWNDLGSPENYVGYERTENFASPGGIVPDQPRVYSAPASLGCNAWALAGEWTMTRESAVLDKAGGRIVYRFHARDLHIVMGPAVPGVPARFRVFIDGQPPGAAHGGDVDERGNGSVTVPRLYQLVRQPGAIVDRQFEIEMLDAGVRVYSFTFG